MSNTIILFVNSVLFYIVYGQKGPCEIAIDGGNRTYGQCKSIFNCQPLLSLANKANKTIEEKVLLQRSHCGIDDYAPAVCCPTQSKPLPCYTPKGDPGQCISVYSCPGMIKLLTPRPPSPEVLEFVQNSRCSKNQYSVCCGRIPNFYDGRTGKCDLTAVPPDPTRGCCGIDGSIDNKIFGGSEVTIDDYPWLAMMEHEKNGSMTLRGNGALISGKYVLTSAGSLNDDNPVNIRLGEYDVTHAGPDCVPVIGGGEDCSDGAISIPIESIIIHPMYNSLAWTNDIALVRMKSTAPYTDFIRPICLPTVDITQETGSVDFFTAGWGKTFWAMGRSESIRRSNVKRQGRLPYVNLSQCQTQYLNLGRNITLGAGHLCAGGMDTGINTCQDDSTLISAEELKRLNHLYSQRVEPRYMQLIHHIWGCVLSVVLIISIVSFINYCFIDF